MTGINNTTPLLAANPPDLLEISFSGKRIYYTGFNIYNVALMYIYDTSDNLLGSSIRYGTGLNFWGVESAKPMGRITLSGSPVIVNQVSFGGRFPWPMYAPAKGGHGATSP